MDGRVVVCALLALSGCASRPAPKPGTVVLAATPAALMPEASPGSRAVLRLGAPPRDKRSAPSTTEFEVALIREVQGSDVSLRLLVDGEPLERELYEARPDAFRLVSAADETFAPAIDLLHYPVREGASWDWEGKVVYAGVSRDARADVAISRDGEDMRTGLTLFVAADPGRPPIKRSFTFWFRKGQGVVERSFGDASSRRPVGGSWRP